MIEIPLPPIRVYSLDGVINHKYFFIEPRRMETQRSVNMGKQLLFLMMMVHLLTPIISF